VAVCARGQDGVDAAVKALGAKGVKAWGRAVDIADGPAITATWPSAPGARTAWTRR